MLINRPGRLLGSTYKASILEIYFHRSIKKRNIFLVRTLYLFDLTSKVTLTTLLHLDSDIKMS